MTLVRDILTAKKQVFNTVSPNTAVLEALHLMRAVNTSYVVVISGTLYKGIFCERDYARNIILRGRQSKNTEVQQVMTTDLPTIRPTNTLEECRMLLEAYRCNYLLVFDDKDQFAGVVTVEDVLHHMVMEKEKVVVPERPEMHLLDEYY